METRTDHIIRISHNIPEALYHELKICAEHQGISVQKLIVQFIEIYNEYLDDSYVQDKSYRKKKQTRFIIYIRADIGKKFLEKLERDQVTHQDVITQFIINYLNFMKTTENTP